VGFESASPRLLSLLIDMTGTPLDAVAQRDNFNVVSSEE